MRLRYVFIESDLGQNEFFNIGSISWSHFKKHIFIKRSLVSRKWESLFRIYVVMLYRSMFQVNQVTEFYE